MLELEVVPERALLCDQWEFVLGMHFSQAVAIIQQEIDNIRGVQMIYSDVKPLSSEMMINMMQDGIKLIFDPVSQRLKVIEVFNLNKVKLKYCGIAFNSPGELPPTIEHIDHSFGATHPGMYDSEKQLYILSFRGLSFYFPVDNKCQPKYARGLGSLQFPNGASPVVCKMLIYSGNNLSETKAPPLPFTCFHNFTYTDSLEVFRDKNATRGFRITMMAEGRGVPGDVRQCKVTKEVRLGMSPEDVCSALGAPSRVYYKADDKMRIHSSSAYRHIHKTRADFFYNYPTLGLDILFDIRSRKAKKFILHTNYPGHLNLNMYHRCEFNLKLPVRTQKEGSNEDMVVSQIGLESSLQVNAFTTWDTIADKLKLNSQKPVVLTRASSTNNSNPFGSTFCYGYQDMIFEVMQNNHIASVTFYSKV